MNPGAQMPNSSHDNNSHSLRPRSGPEPTPDQLQGLSESIASGSYRVAVADVAEAMISAGVFGPPGRSARRD